MKIKHKVTVDEQSQGPLVDYLAQVTSLSKIKIKKAVGAGGCWLGRAHLKSAKLSRMRKVKYELSIGDRLEFYYDENALSYDGEAPFALYERRDYGLWYKPVNVLSQSSRYGDVCSMDRLVMGVSGQAALWIVNRLDREASGIMAIAYTKKAAAKLSERWQGSDVEKSYQLQVKGEVEPKCGEVTFPIDSKAALTEYEVIGRNDYGDSLVEAKIRTGRFHQIRRHFSKMGHPIMGDPRYGKGNAHPKGLQLVCTEVKFTCPFSKKEVHVRVPNEKCLW